MKNQIKTGIVSFTLMAAFSLSSASVANAGVLDFNGFAHGQVMTTQLQGTQGVTISAVNPNRAFNIAAIFNTQFGGSTPDPDLLGPAWGGGNLAAANTVLGNALILSGASAQTVPGILNNPDDEGNNPAGSLILDFATLQTSIGFDLIDVESISAENGAIEFWLGGAMLDSIGFNEFVTAGQFFDPTVNYGNNSANRIQPIGIGDLGPVTRGSANGFDRVVFALGGSGAIDTITFVPEPATATLIALGAIGLIRRRRTM